MYLLQGSKRQSGLERMCGQWVDIPFCTLVSPLSGDQERASRNEGVGIALDEKATVAWKNAGEVWEAVSARIIPARLKWVHTGKKKGGWSGKASGTYVSVVCA